MAFGKQTPKEELAGLIKEAMADAVKELTSGFEGMAEQMYKKFAEANTNKEYEESKEKNAEGANNENETIGSFIKALTDKQMEGLSNLLNKSQPEKSLDELFEDAFKED